jgi:hypothetical protein
VQGISSWQLVIVWAKVEAKAIATKAGDDVQMDMEDLLAGSFAIGQEEVYSLTVYASLSDRIGQLHTHLKEVPTRFRIQFSKAGDMFPGYNQHMPWVDGLYVHESQRFIVGVHDAGWCSLIENVAKHTRPSAQECFSFQALVAVRSSLVLWARL